MSNNNGKNSLEDYAVHQVEFHNGIKGQNLLLNAIAEYPEIEPTAILARVITLVAQGKVIEVEYHTPGQVSRSFLIPRGARIEISK